MFKMTSIVQIFVVIHAVVLASQCCSGDTPIGEAESAFEQAHLVQSYVKGGRVEAHWMADGNSFWYAEGMPENTVIWKVDPLNKRKDRLFNVNRVRKVLADVLGHEPPGRGLPFDSFEFENAEEDAAKFVVEEKAFVLTLDTYEIATARPGHEKKRNLSEQRVRKARFPGADEDLFEVRSPNGQWFAHLKDFNVWLHSADDGRLEPLTTDGVKDHQWVPHEVKERTWAWWSPDSSRIAVTKQDNRKVSGTLVVDWLADDTPTVRYPDAPINLTELFILDIRTKKPVPVDTGQTPDTYIYILGWRADGTELLFLSFDREWKQMDVMAANPTTGATRIVISDKLFARSYLVRHRICTLLKDGKRFIWMSERDGWNHLYLYDLNGTLIRQLTSGNFPVLRVVTVDEKAGWVYFTAHGNQRRPYDTHLYRVGLDGTGFRQLTQDTGLHNVEFSPSRRFFLDRHSSLDRPPVVDLKRVDGTHVQTVSKANVDALAELHWKPPEEFVVKAADGTTEIHGVIYKPYDFDPTKKYPVVEYIYAGPTAPEVGRDFLSHFGHAGFANLGFIIFVVDGRGTPERSREFMEVAFGNIGRHEIPDHVAALRQLGAQRPYMDLSRVGIWGYSWGGYFALRALLMAPDDYHVAVAAAPSDSLGGVETELYMGLPKHNKQAYDYGSNLRLAANLKGKLLLIGGTRDVHAPFSDMMKIVHALTKAEKPYDLIVLVGETHRVSPKGQKYLFDAMWRYFQEHLKP